MTAIDAYAWKYVSIDVDYRGRHTIEGELCIFNDFRRVATGYSKLATNSLKA